MASEAPSGKTDEESKAWDPRSDKLWKYHNIPPAPRPDHLAKEAKQLMFLAKIAEQCRRWDSMIEYMKRVVGLGMQLTEDERNLLATAYERKLAPLRAAYMSTRKEGDRLQVIVDDPTTRTLPREMAEESSIVTHHFHKYFVTPHICEVVDDVMKVVRGVALPFEENALQTAARAAGAPRTFRPISNNSIFYKKMVADYFRYKAEVEEDEAEHKKLVNSAERLYRSVAFDAETLLLPTHPLRLGIALNRAVFYWYVADKDKRENALAVAMDAFQAAVPLIDDVQDTRTAREAVGVLVLLRDNLRMMATNGLAEAARDKAKEERRQAVIEETVAQAEAEEEERRAKRVADSIAAAKARAEEARRVAMARLTGH